MAAPSLTYTLTNGNTADASQVMQDLNDLLNGYSDGTKDLTISALIANGAVSFKGTVGLGDSTADDITVTGSLASTIPIKTNNAFDFGSSTLGLAGVYLGGGGVGLTCRLVAASHATTRTYTFPDAGAAANVVLSEATATINGTKTFAGQLIGKGTQTNDSASAGYIGEYIELTAGVTSFTSATGHYQDFGGNGTALALTKGDWEVTFTVYFLANAATITSYLMGITTTTGDSSTGLTAAGSNYAQIGGLSVANSPLSLTVPSFRVSLSADTSYYGKLFAQFGAGTPQYAGRLSARRLR